MRPEEEHGDLAVGVDGALSADEPLDLKPRHLFAFEPNQEKILLNASLYSGSAKPIAFVAEESDRRRAVTLSGSRLTEYFYRGAEGSFEIRIAVQRDTRRRSTPWNRRTPPAHTSARLANLQRSRPRALPKKLLLARTKTSCPLLGACAR